MTGRHRDKEEKKTQRERATEKLRDGKTERQRDRKTE